MISSSSFLVSGKTSSRMCYIYDFSCQTVFGCFQRHIFSYINSHPYYYHADIVGRMHSLTVLEYLASNPCKRAHFEAKNRRVRNATTLLGSATSAISSSIALRSMARWSVANVLPMVYNHIQFIVIAPECVTDSMSLPSAIALGLPTFTNPSNVTITRRGATSPAVENVFPSTDVNRSSMATQVCTSHLAAVNGYGR